MKKYMLFPLLLLVSLAHAEEKGQPLPNPPGQQPQVEDGEVLEPDVTIIEQKDKTIEQYSINGRMYMVKITPRVGPPYYLLDLDGDGQMDVRRDSPMDISVPQWVLFSW